MIALLIVFIIVAAAVAAGLHLSSVNAKSATFLLDDAKTKLSKNPENIASLKYLSEYYLQEKNWAAASYYLVKLVEIGQKDSSVPLQETALKSGICFIMLEKYNDALKDLVSSYALNNDSLETNFNLGITYFRLNNLERALLHFKKSRDFSPEIEKWLALTYCNSGMTKEGLAYCTGAIEKFYDDTELIFAYAHLLELTANEDAALQFYEKLFSDKIFGSRACYHAGVILHKRNRFEEAVGALEKSLSFAEFSDELFIQTNYALGIAYFSMNRINDGISALKDVLSRIDEYKDTKSLIEKYSELAKNENLRIYLYGSTQEFERVIKKIADEYFKHDGLTEISEVSWHKETVDCILFVKMIKHEKRIFLSFFRETGPVGELYIRDFNEKIHEARCSWGLFVSSGTFLPGAYTFSENRSIDLIDKTKLDKLFSALSSYETE